jgi:hypothetical protein
MFAYKNQQYYLLFTQYEAEVWIILKRFEIYTFYIG